MIFARKLRAARTYVPMLSVALLSTHAAGGASVGAQAMEYFQKGNYKAAQPLFEKLVASSPTDGRALYYLAIVYYKQNNIPEAQSEFQKVVSAFPKSQEAKFSLQYLNSIDSKSVFSEENSRIPTATTPTGAAPQATTPAATSSGNDRAERDLTEAKAQAEQIMNEAKRHAAEFDKRAKDQQDEMKQVMVGRQFARPAYSQDQLNAATAGLRQQSKETLERGKKESEDLLNRAQMRYEAQTRTH